MSDLLSKLKDNPMLLMGLNQITEAHEDNSILEQMYHDAAISSAEPEIATLLKTYNHTLEAFRKLDSFMMTEFSEPELKNKNKIKLAKALTEELNNLMYVMSKIILTAKSTSTSGK